MLNESFVPDLGIKEISNERKAFFRTARPNKRTDIDSNKLVTDFSAIENFKSTQFRKFSEKEQTKSESDDLRVYEERIEKLKNEWKYCPIIRNQFDNNKCCIYTGFFRLKLQKIIHSIPFHIIVSLLVIIDVLIVILELTIETRQLAFCSTESDCEDKCNCTETPTKAHKNETEHLVCGFVGLTHQCVLESQETPDVSRILSIVTITILSIFLVEILIKLFAFGIRFFKKCFEVFDAIVVITSFIFGVVQFFLEENEFLIFFELLIILRLWRIVRIITASIAAYNAVEEEKNENKLNTQFNEEAKNHLGLMKEYEFAKCEIIRIRELLITLKENPFPREYGITREEASCVGFNLHPV